MLRWETEADESPSGASGKVAPEETTTKDALKNAEEGVKEVIEQVTNRGVDDEVKDETNTTTTRTPSQSTQTSSVGPIATPAAGPYIGGAPQGSTPGVPPYGGYMMQPVPYNGYAMPSATVPPQPGTAVGPFSQPPQHVMMPMYYMSEAETRLLNTYSLGRGIRVLSVIDFVFIIINVFAFGVHGFYQLALAVGPICGMMAATNYSVNYAWVYLFYYIIRISWDIFASAYYGVMWFIVSVVVDVFIARFVGTFIDMLRTCRPEELALLRNPGQLRERASNYFGVF